MAERIDAGQLAVHVENDRDDQVLFASVPEQALVFSPVRQVEARGVEAWVVDAVGPRSRPGVDQEGEVRIVRHGWFVPLNAAFDARRDDGDAEPVDLEARQPVDALANDLFVTPADEVIGRRGVPEEVLAGAFPDEVERMRAVHPDGAFPFALTRGELAKVLLLRLATAIAYRVTVPARLRRHEADAEDGAVLAVAEAVHFDRRSAFAAELADHLRFRERIPRRRMRDVEPDLDKVIAVHAAGRWLQRHGGFRSEGEQGATGDKKQWTFHSRIFRRLGRRLQGF